MPWGDTMDMRHGGLLVLIWMTRGSTKYGMEETKMQLWLTEECIASLWDCCFALFVVCLVVCYNIFKRSLFCSCATKTFQNI